MGHDHMSWVNSGAAASGLCAGGPLVPAVHHVCNNKQRSGWGSVVPRMKAHLAVNAVEMAVAHRGRPSGVKVHSDRGSQFQSRKFTGSSSFSLVPQK